MNNYPAGADNEDAPWNEVNNPEIEVEVLVTITLSKVLKVTIDDYEIIDSGINEDNEYFEDIDYSDYDFKEALEKQHLLPQHICDGWELDEFEVIKE